MTAQRRTKNAKKKPNLKLIQGGKSGSTRPKAKEKKPAKPEPRVHPFAHFFKQGRTVGSAKPNSYDHTMHHQIPRKKAV